MSFQPLHLLQNQKGEGCYHLKYYQEIMHILGRFVDDPNELRETRRRLGIALAEYELE
ncbi:MAG: hypothetical protein J1E57_06145 [Prevotella sp.]|nr:hypothetical protein [Prevotella sp.]